MFNFISLIRMLELVLFWVEMERKTLDCVYCNPGCIVDYYHYVHDSLIGWMRPYLSLFV